MTLLWFRNLCCLFNCHWWTTVFLSSSFWDLEWSSLLWPLPICVCQVARGILVWSSPNCLWLTLCSFAFLWNENKTLSSVVCSYRSAMGGMGKYTSVCVCLTALVEGQLMFMAPGDACCSHHPCVYYTPTCDCSHSCRTPFSLPVQSFSVT